MSGPRPIALISDFGNGPYLGVMKAVIKSISPGSEIIDIDNSVPSFSVLAGAYIVATSYYWMPKSSIIVAVVDPGVGTGRKAVIVETEDYYFVGPDNGVLYPAIHKEGIKSVYEIVHSKVSRLAFEKFRGKIANGSWHISSTFHGRDVFAPAAALISSGEADLQDLGERIDHGSLKRLSIEHVERMDGSLRAQVIYIDKFGNVTISASPKMTSFRRWQGVTVTTQSGNFTVHCGRTFSNVNPHDLIIYENSFGYLEIAVNQGNAARKLDVDIGDRITLTPIE